MHDLGVGNGFIFDGGSDRSLKGFSRPAVVYELLGAADQATCRRRIASCRCISEKGVHDAAKALEEVSKTMKRLDAAGRAVVRTRR